MSENWGSNAIQESPTFPDAHNVTRREWCALQASAPTTRTSTTTTTTTRTRTTSTSGLTVFTRRGQTFWRRASQLMPAEQFTGGCRCEQANMKGGEGRHTPPFVCSYTASLTGKGRRGARAAAAAADAADHALLLDTKHDYEAHMYTHVPVHGNARRGVVMHTPLTRGKKQVPIKKELLVLIKTN